MNKPWDAYQCKLQTPSTSVPAYPTTAQPTAG
jgi:hypothetical protein